MEHFSRSRLPATSDRFGSIPAIAAAVHLGAALGKIPAHSLVTPASKQTGTPFGRVISIAPVSLLPAWVGCNSSHTGGSNAGSVLAPLSNTPNGMNFSATVVCVATDAAFSADRQLYSRRGEIRHCRHLSRRDKTSTSARSSPPRGPTEGHLRGTSLRDRPRQNLRGVHWVLGYTQDRYGRISSR